MASIVSGPVQLTDVDVDRSVVLKNWCFLGDVDAERAIFERNLVLDQSVFRGSVDFSWSHVVENLRFRDAHFVKDASFDRVRIGGALDFRHAVFDGPADFSDTHVGGFLNARDAQVTSTGLTDFSGMRIDQSAVICGAFFGGPADFSNSTIGGILRANVIADKEFKCSAARFTEDAIFDAMHVRGVANFTGAQFDHSVSFQWAQFVTVNFSNVVWPPCATNGDKKRPIMLEGMTYRNIYVGTKDDRPGVSCPQPKDDLDLLGQASFSGQSYTTLENVRRSEGDIGAADNVFIHYQRRLRVAGQLSAWGKLGNGFLDLLVEYGRQPWRAFVYGLFVIAIGVATFPENRMRSTSEGAADYSRWWYSVDLFVPGVDLGIAKSWVPDQRKVLEPSACYALVAWMHLERLLGWLLIPALQEIEWVK